MIQVFFNKIDYIEVERKGMFDIGIDLMIIRIIYQLLKNRAKEENYTIWYEPDSKIWHKAGSTRKRTEAEVYRGYKTSLIYMKKHMHRNIWPLWFFAYLLYSLIFGPSRHKKNFDVPILNSLRGILHAFKEGYHDTSITKADFFQYGD